MTRRIAAAKLKLKLACWASDRVRALADGRVGAEGLDLQVEHLPMEEMFVRMLQGQEFDASEMSLSSYVVSLASGSCPFVAIPVFPSRMFRHSCLYVAASGAVRHPEDLAGKRLGVPEYQMTAGVWMRGTLEDEYGVAHDSVQYFTGGAEAPGRDEKISLNLPSRIHVRNIGSGKTLVRMLMEGELDALQVSRVPAAMRDRSGGMRRLFEDFVGVEHEYYRRTRIFPIMHVIVVRRELHERHGWIAQALYDAFVRAKRLAQEDLSDTVSLRTMLPWMLADLEWLQRESGGDWWPYGVEPNRRVLETFLRYHHSQGLSARRVLVDELFVPTA